MTEANATYIASALIVAVTLWAVGVVRRHITNTGKKLINKLEFVSMKVDSMDYGLSKVEGIECDATFKNYQKHRSERWEQLVSEHKIKNEGLY